MSQLELYEVLRGLGVEENKARAAVNLDQAAATKSDVAALKIDMVALEAKLSEVKASLIVWMIGTQIALAGLMLALLRGAR